MDSGRPIAPWLLNAEYRRSHGQALLKKSRRGDCVARDGIAVLDAVEICLAQHDDPSPLGTPEEKEK